MQKRFGDSLSPAVKYWIFLTGIITVTFTVIFGSFIASYLNLSAEDQAVFDKLFDKLIPFPFIGSIILVAFICTMVSLLFRYYIIPVLSMAEQTRLITTANPDYRITAEGARELVMLADVINESADAFQELQSEVENKIHLSNLALKEERNRLAALMSELPYGVVVCNQDGRILLYSRLAQEMLQPADGEQEGGGGIGLGRSIFGVLERDPLVHALQVMNHAFTLDQAKPALGLMTKLCGTRFIRVNMAPVTGNEENARFVSGFVLSLEDITGEIEADSERDRLLQGMVDAVQNSLGKLHRGINAICNFPDSGDKACELHRQEISLVTNDLEEQLALARKLYSEHRRAYGNRENVLADTLMTLIAKNLDERFAVKSETHVNKTIWLKLDSYAIVQTITTLAGLLKAEYGISAITLQIDSSGEPLATLTIKWSDQAVPGQAIRDWQTAPLFMDSDGTSDSPETIINGHGGNITIAQTDDIFCNGIRVSLTKALDEETAQLHSPVAPRPVSYEFDLFHQPGQDTLGKISLRKLTYVAFDTETTGLKPSEGDEIVQLGAVRIVNGRLLHNECFDQLVNPQRPVPKSSVEIHGIDPELLPSQPVITRVLPVFHAFAADSVLVAHNAAFDMRFLQLKEQASGVSFDNPVLDTLLLSSVVHPNQEGHSLDAIAERFNITIVGRHTALGDALVTAEILLRLIPLLEAQGIHTLEEALRASIKSSYVKIKY
ncbi:MAG: exonuclease domain-containing protein [Desulfuromonadales bacterium]